MLHSAVEEVERVFVVAIVGMAGVGKTTMSQFLFNDDRLLRWFEVKSWVYVCDGSNVLQLTNRVYESVTRSSSGKNSGDLSMMQVQLNEILNGKRLFLVLDDFWAESFFDWDLFKMAFASVAPGSVIVVTTRNENVATTMRASIHFPSRLPDPDCWDIFAHYAFRDRDPEAANPALVEIGEEIVRKCKGLPLAAKVLGSLLYSVDDAEKWNNILHSKMWDLPSNKSNILSALRLSYQILPSHLKACFAYCSVFPKGYEINKWNLIHLWMAEGLLQPLNTEPIYMVGEEYFHELLSRSLLQRSINNDSCVIMHDLVSDLAQYVGGNFFHFFQDGNDRRIPEKVRHLSFLQEKLDALEMFEAFYSLSQLRTFLSLGHSNSRLSDSLTYTVFNSLIPRFVSTRVLSLSGYPVTALPNSIGNLKHLRYLNLSRTKIQQLPESVGHLYNLQILLLSHCVHLTSLPKYLQNLTDLRHLDISGAPLIEMPENFGRLTLLQHLTTFVVSQSTGTGSRISELGGLSQLNGSLCIVNLHGVRDATDAAKANLMGKSFIDELIFKWTNVIHDMLNEAVVLENLQPHKKLKELKIENYGGMTFPGWLGRPSFFNMVSVHLVGCINCLTLPPLGQLSSLKILLIENMASLIRVGPEFYGNVNTPFRGLEILTFEDLLIWEEWVQVEEFPSLKELYIRRCPVLGGNMPHHLGSLNKLIISECHNLANSFASAPMLTELELIDCDALVSLPEEMRRLTKVTICNCSALQNFPALGIHSRLKSLHISQCMNLQLFQLGHAPQDYKRVEHLHLESTCTTLVSFELSSFWALRNLYIQDCPNLQSLSMTVGAAIEDEEKLTHLEKIQIKDCPSLVSFPEGGLPTPRLRLLSICNCPNLSPQMEWGLHETSLECFRIEGNPFVVESFPNEGLLPACLTSLHISGLVNLESLDQTGLQHLIFLKLLEINGCNMLQSLPAQGLPNSLSSLIIMDCPLLVPLCQSETGPYWPLIAHIPFMVIC